MSKSNFLVLTGVLALLPAVMAQEKAKQPVYIQMFTSLEDHLNIQMTEERARRTLAMVERLREKYPQYRASCLIDLNGAASEQFDSRRKATGLMERITALSGKGIEVGYNGSNEPTELERPRPNFRRAKTSETRWLARLEAFQWLLDDFKEPVTGKADADRSGGLKRTQEVFGKIASVYGVSRELGGDPELVHCLRQYNHATMMPGIPENTTYPAKLLHGYGGGVAELGRLVSPEPDFAPEVFWQDGVLRVSDFAGPGTGIVYIHSGPEALQKRLAALDRSRAHVIRLYVSHHLLHLQPKADKAMLANPLQWGYENPKAIALPIEAFLPPQEVDAGYAREESAIKWLVEEFFPANPGSRFLSVADLTGMAQTGVPATVSRESLAIASRDLLQEWGANNYPPSYARAAKQYFSLADMYQMLTTALAEYHRSGSLPESVPLHHVYGPFEITDEQGPPLGEVKFTEVAAECTGIAKILNDETWRPVPANIIPAWTTAGGIRLNAAQFLRLMATAYVDPGAGKQFRVRTCQMFAGIGLTFPYSRPRPDLGATWTLKPAMLRAGN